MTKPSPKSARGGAGVDERQRIAGVLFGCWLAVVPVKFGNPVIFEHMLGVPEGFYGLLLSSWPVPWSYAALGLIAIAAVLAWRWKPSVPKWLAVLPLAWFAWTLLSATQTAPDAARLTLLTLLQFGGCVLCFYAGMFGLSELRDFRPLWAGLAVGLVFILATALHQHFGGLEETRRWFEQQPPEVRAQFDTPEFRKKILSDRVFGTFVYPNALAGGLLLLLPVTLAGVGQLGHNIAIRWTLCGALSLGGLAALYWSGSKSGWLIALTMAGLALWRMPARFSFKAIVLTGLVALGVAAFLAKHGAYFEKGASSLSARRDYWRAAGKMVQQKPLLGYGPGAFQRQYGILKPADAEMAKLAHNDYLQQAADSGIPAGLAYAGFIAASILLLYRRSTLTHARFAAWLGAFGFAAQSLTEFGLYIPALAWPFFLFLGWLWGASPNQIDNPIPPSYLSPAKK